MENIAPQYEERRTNQGLVRGLSDGVVGTFLSVPYAAPPEGQLRFAKPRLPDAWSGIRDATSPGPCAPHKIAPFPALDVVPLVGEGSLTGGDYLTLNIWAPLKAANAPVMVFIHGGGFVIGSKDSPVNDGTEFARSGVVLVAINYRMGIDGFLPIPGVPTNLGLRDMLFALEWIRDNIANFGGDASNVTVFGESAGAMAIADLVTSPLAKGLFQKAIIQSGHGSMVRDPKVAHRLVERLAKVLKIPATRDGFASVSYEAGWKAMEKVSRPLFGINLRDENGFEPVYGISRFIPVYGDDVLPVPPLEALAQGAGKDINVLIGTNAEEMNLYFVPTKVKEKIPAFLAKWMLGRSHPGAKKALKAYGLGTKGKKPGHAMTEAMHDLVFRWPAREFAAAHQGITHMYELDWRSPACDGKLGAAHGIDLPFVFKKLDIAHGEKGLCGLNPPEDLATRIHDIWVGFGRDGMLSWPVFEPSSRKVHQLHADTTIEEEMMLAANHLSPAR